MQTYPTIRAHGAPRIFSVASRRTLLQGVFVVAMLGVTSTSAADEIVSRAGAENHMTDSAVSHAVTLREGRKVVEDNDQVTRTVTGEPLEAGSVEEVLSRLPAWQAQARESQKSNFPPRTLPPPRAGEIVDSVFPPEGDSLGVPEQPAAGALQVLRFQPEGEVGIAPYLSVTFSQPMVALSTLDELNDSAQMPVKMTPQLPGRWQWIGTRTLRFDYMTSGLDRLPMATAYEVEIPAGTRSQTGGVLEQTVRFSFATPPVSVRAVEPLHDSLPLLPNFLIMFDQIIDPQSALRAITLRANGQPVDLRLATDNEVADDRRLNSRVAGLLDGRWLAMRPVNPLTPDTNIEIVVDAQLASAEGPRRGKAPFEFSAKTYAALAVHDQSCRGRRKCEPQSDLWMTFNNMLDVDAFDAASVTITPSLEDARLHVNGNTLSIRGATKGNTRYEVTLPESLRDAFGQTLGEPATVRFDVGRARPWLHDFGRSVITLDPLANAQSLAVRSMNHKRLRVRAFRVTPDDWNAYSRYHQDRHRDPAKALRAPWDEILNELVDTDAPDDVLSETAIDLNAVFGGAPGHAVVIIEPTGSLAALGRNSRLWWQNRPVVTWVQSTRIGLDAFSDAQQLVAWTTDLASGAPLASVEVALAGGGPNDYTNDSGLARLPLNPTHQELLIATRDNDSAILPGGWAERAQQDSAIWYVFDDRGTYKPGEQVRVKGWVRALTLSADAQLTRMRNGTTVQMVARDWQGNELARESVAINALGGFDFAIDIPNGANLGRATIELVTKNAGVQSAYAHAFAIQEFRRPEFEVAARTQTGGPFIAGESATAVVDAAYFAGGALPGAEVTWRVRRTSASYTPPNRTDYVFGVWRPWWISQPIVHSRAMAAIGPRESLSPAEELTGLTNAEGSHLLEIVLDGDGEGLPSAVFAEATVQDVNRQAWTSSTNMLVHPGTLYVGLRSERMFVRRGDLLEVDAIVTNIDGELIAGHDIRIDVGLLQWRYVDGEWTNEPESSQSCDVTAQSDPVRCSFATDAGGEYRISATVADEAGRVSRSELTRWVSGADAKPTRNVERETLVLIPNAERYMPGESAEILLQSPISPAEGLLTVSRNGHVSTTPFTVNDDGSAVLSVPIEEEYVPNVHVQVDVVGASVRTADDGTAMPNAPERTAFASGTLSLSVPPLARTLKLVASPAQPEVTPGSETTLNVTVHDASDQPLAGAEIAVVVADEAVLALSNYSLPDPNDIFYVALQSGVRTVYGRDGLVLSDVSAGADDVAEEAMMADGMARSAVTSSPKVARMAMAGAPAADAERAGGGGPIDVRNNFDALAVFAPEVTTDANGKATVSVPLPDNLTRYRVMVVAVDGDDRFGAVEANITARLPLMVRASAPRFLNYADHFELPVVVQNQTAENLIADVVVQASNLSVVGSAGRRVSVPANDRVEVRFPTRAEHAGTARFRVAATSGALADAAVTALPVYTPASSEAFAVYGVLDKGGVTQPLTAPSDVIQTFGGLEINTSATALQALTDAVIYLKDYPYASSDAYASRILAIVALRDVLSAFQVPQLPAPKELQRVVTLDLERLLSLQNRDGGFPFWRPHINESAPFNSIQAAHALTMAHAAGYSVAQEPLSRALSYLRDIDSFIQSHVSNANRFLLNAYALHVRALAGEQLAAVAEQMYARRDAKTPQLDALAWLWPLIESASIREEIGRTIANRVTETAGAATFVTSFAEDAHLVLHSARRTDGIVLAALVSEAPESDLIAKVVSGLLAHKKRGRWGNVQENTYILLALKAYFDAFEAQSPDFVARIWLGERFAGEHAYAGRSATRNQTVVTMADLLAQKSDDILMTKDGVGRLYYRLGLRYAPRDLKLEALDRGFVVERRYEAVDDPEDVRRDDDGTWRIKAGATVRVILDMVVESRRTHVALVDRLPAGLEAMNPSLAVTGDTARTPRTARAHTRWWWQWFQHQNLRDERAEAYAALVSAGTYDWSYVARATTPGKFSAPPARAEEIYAPETFGRSGSDTVVVE